MARLREAWTTIVLPEDCDAHMVRVGQAEANAQLLADWLRSEMPRSDSSILFAGAGTGQMFDFFPAELLSPYRVTFTDINSNFLKCLESRLKSKAKLSFQTSVDDIERSQLPAGFTLAVAVLVLEHVDWRLAVASLCRLTNDNVFVIIQVNPPQLATAVSGSQPLYGTMRIFREVHPMLVNRKELVQEFDHHGFDMAYFSEKQVLYEKKMIGLGFTKRKPDLMTRSETGCEL